MERKYKILKNMYKIDKNYKKLYKKRNKCKRLKTCFFHY